MAKSRSDVELVIRARDLGSKSIQELEKTIQKLVSAQEEAAKAGDASARSLRDLQQEYRDLDAASRALVSRGSLAQSFTEQTKSVELATAKLEQARAKMLETAQAAKAAGDANKALNAEARTAERVFNSATTAYERANTKLELISEDLRAAGFNTADLVNEQQRLVESAKQVSAALDRNENAIRGYDAALAKASQERKLAENLDKELRAQAEALRKAAAQQAADAAAARDAEIARELAAREQAAARAVAIQRDLNSRLLAANSAARAQELSELRQDIEARASAQAAANARLQAEQNRQVATDTIRDQEAARARELAALRRDIEARNNERVRLERELSADLDRELRKQAQQARAAAAEAARLNQQRLEASDRIRRAIKGDERETLSLYQRIRGEVIALTTAYVGLFGAISQIQKGLNERRVDVGNVSRIQAIVGDDPARVAKELAFIRAEADRLGQSYTATSEAYTKFLAGAVSSGASLNEVRTIYTKLSEAAVVAGLSQDDLNGVLKAVEQIFSKTTVQAEELRGQLGDRLPGAVAAYAASLGVSTAELNKLIEAGKVGADTLVDFARQFNENFAKGLPNALNTADRELARFNNTLADARKAFIQGLEPGLVAALKELGEALKDPDTLNALREVGKGLGDLLVVLAKLGPYLDEIAKALVVFAGGKVLGAVGKSLAGVVLSLGELFTAFKLLRTGGGIAAAATALGGVTAAGTGVVGMLKLLVPRLLALLGPLGLVASAVYLLWDAFAAAPKTSELPVADQIRKLEKQLEDLATKEIDFRRRSRESGGVVVFDDQAKQIENRRKKLRAEIDALKKEAAEADAKTREENRFKEAEDARIRDLEAQEAAATESKRIADKKAADAKEGAEKQAKALEQYREALAKLGEDLLQLEGETSLQATFDRIDSEINRRIADLKKTAQKAGVDPAAGVAIAENLRAQQKAAAEQKFNAEQARAAEKAVNDVIAERTAIIERINLQRDRGLITEQQGAQQVQEGIAATEARFQAALAAAQKWASVIKDPELVASLQQIGLEQDKLAQRSEFERQVARVNELLQQRDAIITNQAALQQLYGLTAEQAQALVAERTAGLNSQISQTITLLQQMVAQLSGPEAEKMKQTLEDLGLRIQALDGPTQQFARSINENLADGLTDTVLALGKGLGEAEDALKSFASSFLRFLAEYIAKKIIINALDAAGSGGAGGFIAGLFHTGGVVGAPRGSNRLVSPGLFAAAPRYHTGGVVGLAPNEVPAILKRNEEVLTEDDPRNVLNGGAGGQAQTNVKIINAIDSGSVVSEGLSTPAGTKAILNVIRANRAAVRQELA